MLELTFGEQVKIVLNRKDMTIKQLAEMIEERTGKKMSRQNLTQRLARDNFQEQDMRLIASILECPFHLSILEENADSEYTARENIKIDKRDEKIIIDGEPEQLTLNLEYDEPEQVQEEQPVKAGGFGLSGAERDITIGELVDIHKDLDQMEETSEYADQTGYEEPAEYEESAEYEQSAEYEEPAEYEEEPQSSEAPEYDKQEDVKDILEEMAAIEAEEKKAREDREEREREREREREQEKEQEKPRGWRAYFPRRKKKQAEPVHEDKQEAATEQFEAESAMNQAQPENITEKAVTEEQYQESEEYQEPKEYQEPEEYQEAEEYQETGEYQEAEPYQESEPYQEEEQTYEEYVEENQQDMEEEFADTAQDWEAPEEENVGDINPYTGMEYESNSVRMHPKRIGYVQVYDRSDHQWTDMTEWAFLGYQERKKALLGKDYEPPIYLD